MTILNTVSVLKPQAIVCTPDEYTSDDYWITFDGPATYDAGNGWWEIDYPVGGAGYMRIESDYSWPVDFTPHTMIITIDFVGIDTGTYPSEWVYFTDDTEQVVFANFSTDFSSPISVDLTSFDGKPYRIRHTWDFGTPATGSLRISSILFDSCP